MKEKVTIIGAGVGGLSAAHELVKRGFKVTVYDRRMVVGGKALSGRTKSGRVALPTEHGFRFFPGWYRHLLATMAEIPIASRAAFFPEVNVASNLVRTETSRMLWSDRPPIPVPMHLPRTFTQAKSFADFVLGMSGLGLANGEIAFFLSRIAAFLAMPEDVRLVELQKITWWEFVGAETKSQAYQDLISATTRTLIAANAKEASAYTLGRLAVRTLSDALGGIDHVLNGPTSEAWLESWRAHLQNEGVEFKFGLELDAIIFGNGERRIKKIELSSVAAGMVRKLRRLLPTILHEGRVIQDAQQKSRPPEGSVQWSTQERLLARSRQRIVEHSEVARALIAEIRTITGNPTLLDALKDVAEHLDEVASRAGLNNGSANATEPPPNPGTAPEQASVQQSPGSSGPSGYVPLPVTLGPEYSKLCEPLWNFEEAEANVESDDDYFIFALPVEQMAYYVQRSNALTTLDPKLAGIVQLANHTDWMAGIQFYLEEKVSLGKGHFILMDSPWALTAIEQRQFWTPGADLSSEIQGILSVDIANWSLPGRFTRKKARDCTDDEIAHEVWAELKAAHNRPGQKDVLTDALLRGNKQALDAKTNFFLDRSVVDLFDRKKQAAFEKTRSVQFSTLDRNDPRASSTPFISGPRLRFNTEPLLINRVGTWALRPTAKTGIVNMFLAADYIRTETDLACMEGANEAARRAVNALLDVTGSTEARCEIWPFSVPQNLAAQLLRLAQLDENPTLTAGTAAVARMADSAADLASRAGDALRSFLKKG